MHHHMVIAFGSCCVLILTEIGLFTGRALPVFQLGKCFDVYGSFCYNVLTENFAILINFEEFLIYL